MLRLAFLASHQTQPANLLKQQDTWFGPNQAELAQADLGENQFSRTFPSQLTGVWIAMTDGSGFTYGANSYILMRFAPEEQTKVILMQKSI